MPEDYEIDNKWFFIIWGALIVWLASFKLHYIPDEAFGLFLASLGLILTGTSDRLWWLPGFPWKQVDDPNRE